MQQEDINNNKILSFLENHKVNEFIEGISVEENIIYCIINATTLNQEDSHIIANTIKNLLFQHYPEYKVSCSFIKQPLPKNTLPPKQSIPHIQHIIGIASGKGGVGKSTLSVNLAYALAKKNVKVGILDADLYGPSIHFMLAGNDLNSNSKQLPLFYKEGISYTSIALLLKQSEDPILLKAPRAVKLLKQLLLETPWQPLDVLIVDLPPGTGDINLHLALNYKLTGIISICTPQKLAILDLQKALNMYRKTKTPILGIIENMSSFICPKCLHISNIFDKHNLKQLAIEQAIPFLGDIPLDLNLRESTDNSQFILNTHPHSATSTSFQRIANHILTNIKKA
ncbi:Iron-sulfur cluster carrier protein [Candidatus Hepatincola sp. Pdp]